MTHLLLRLSGALALFVTFSLSMFAVSFAQAPSMAQMVQSQVGGAMNMDPSDQQEKAAPTMIGDLEISPLLGRAMPPRAQTGGAFFTVTNHGTVADRLVSASSDVAEHVEMHVMRMDGGVMKMNSVPEGFMIPPGETLVLAPGGKHLMFIGVHEPFKQGQEVPVGLTFEHAGTVSVFVHILPIGADIAGMGDMDMSNMNGTMKMDSENMEMDGTKMDAN